MLKSVISPAWPDAPADGYAPPENSPHSEAFAASDSQRQLSLALEAGQLGFWDWNISTGRVQYGGCWASMLGCSPEDIEPTIDAWQKLVHPNDAPHVARVLKLHLDGLTSFYECEFRLPHKDGTWRWILSRGQVIQRGADGRPVRAIGTHTDVTSRRQAEQALRESEERYRATFDNAGVGIAHVALDGRWLRFNSSLCVITGYSPEELRARTFGDITHPDDLEADWAQARRLLSGEIQSYTLDKRYLRKDGSAVWVRLTGSLTRDTAGNPQNFIAVVQDVSVQKQAEEVLRNNEAHVRRVLDNLFAFVGVLAPDGTLVDANRAPLEAAGISETDVIGKKFWEAYWWSYSPEAQARLQDSCQRACNGEVVRYDVEVRMAGGRMMWIDFQIAPLRNAEGRITHLIPSAMDLTDRKRAEQALRESEARFRAMADNLPQLAWMADHEGSLFWLNKRWYDFTGTDFEQMRGWGWKEVHHPDHVQAVCKSWQAALNSGKPWQHTFPLRQKDGQYRWFLSRAFPIRDEAGKITRWFGTNTDITELRNAEQALLQAQTELRGHAANLEKVVEERTARLRETVEELEVFSYSIAHDLRAPLRSLHGFADLLAQEHREHLNATGQDYLQRISTAAARMDKLILDVLNYSKVTRGDATFERVSMPKLLDDIVRTYPGLSQNGSSISVAPNVPDVSGNEALLAQVFSNLLGNAAKFVRPGFPPEILIWGERHQRRARIFVKDNGIGIALDQHAKIFRMFQRVDKTYEGSGIGLAIVQRTVQRMGGAVGVQSTPGEGSTFWVELPLAD